MIGREVICTGKDGTLYREGIDYTVSENGINILTVGITNITVYKEPQKPNRQERRNNKAQRANQAAKHA